MKAFKFIRIILFLLLINTTGLGQKRNAPKLLKSKGDFTHNSTGTIFPEQIDGYSRKSIYSFTKEDDDIEVTYESAENTSVLIKIYSAGDGIEGRLRDEYLKSLQEISIAARRTIGFEQTPIRRVGAKYICNGFKAVSDVTIDGTERLLLYECGAWFLKIKISSIDLDTNQVKALEEKILIKFDPTKLTELKPLPLKSELVIAPGLGMDRLRAKYIINSALKKLEWANANISENERASGFPDLYLNMHIAAFKEFAECKVVNYQQGNHIAKLINDVNTVIKAGYLPEFIMKQYSMIMIVPETMKFDFEGYDKFAKENNNPSIDLSRHYYLIVFRQNK